MNKKIMRSEQYNSHSINLVRIIKSFMETYNFSYNTIFVQNTKFITINELVDYKVWNCCGHLIFCNPDHFKLMTDSIITRNNLLVGRLTKTRKNVLIESEIEILFAYKYHLLSAFLQWVEQYLHKICLHFKTRISNNKILLNHDAIKIEIARIFSSIFLIKKNLTELSFENSFSLMVKLFMEIFPACMKLHGARAIIEKNALEAFWLFQLVVNVYFSHEEEK